MELNYKRLGSGKPLIILHGLFGALDNWMTLGKKWAESREVWLVDERNHGQSPHSDDFSYEYMAADLQEFIDHHGITAPDILGHSMGGKTAMQFARNAPSQLDRLIVADIAPVAYEVHHAGIITALKSVDLAKIQSRSEAKAALAQHISELGVQQFLLKNLYWKTKEQLDWRFNLDVLADEIEPISEWETTGGRFNGPTLFVRGGKSEYVLDMYWPSILDAFPNATIETIDNAGHWLHAEAPQTFFKIVTDFLETA